LARDQTTNRRRLLRLSFSGLFALGVVSVGAAQATTTWSKNLFVSSAMVYQDPYPTACTAATTMTMLNTIAYRHTGGIGFIWTPYRVKNDPNPHDLRDLTSIVGFARAHDTLSVYGTGSDPHGWRNALNYYGWGSAVMTEPTKRIYETLAYATYDAAVHAAVRAIAKFGMPVGIASWAGEHAQILTGYVVDGANPETSDAFTVRYVYLTDPLFLQGHVDLKVSNATLKSGTFVLRFQSYREADSPYDDPYSAGWKRSSVAYAVGPSQWYHRWVIVAPVRSTVPTPTPTPSPTPTPLPSADPSPSATASPPAPSQDPASPDSTAQPDPSSDPGLLLPSAEPSQRPG
jgi:hypothetical protein